MIISTSWAKWFVLLTLVHMFSAVFSEKCNDGRITFERTPGLRMPIKGEDVLGPLEYFPGTPPTACYGKCLASHDCQGYFFDHDDLKCVLISDVSWPADGLLEHSSSWSYHRKICLGGKSCHRQWAFDRIPGVQLFGYDDKRLSSIQSRDLCLERCSVEESFVCRSARYDPTNKTCILSRHDRRTAPEAFRKSVHQVEYLENQCITEPSRCMFHPQKGRMLVPGVHVQRTPALSRQECELDCVQHTDFTCRSFEFNPDSRRCLLSPDDSYSSPERLGIPSAQGRYFYERGSCIEVRMHCEATSMTAVVKVITPFRGRLYALGHPYECYAVSVRANGEVALTMPLHGRTCGTKNLGNGTFVNSVVVQHHPFVLRNTDRRIDVACDYEEVQRKLRGGKQVLEGDLQTLSQVITGLAAAPPVRLRVVNASGLEVQGVELGEQLFLRVEMLDETVFGIFGSNLVVRSGRGTETVLLIDEEGCPIEPEIFPSLKNTDGSKSLVAPFQAFKFASESTVKFQLTVSFCLDVCSPATCSDESTEEKFQSFGRKKRDKHFELQAGDVVTDVTMETPLFVVRNIRSSASENNPYHTKGVMGAPRSNEQGVCLTRPVLYTVAIVGSLAQAAFLVCCLSLFSFVRKFRRKQSDIKYLRSNCSISSQHEFCPKS